MKKPKMKILHKVFLFSIGLVSLVIIGVIYLNNSFLEEYYAHKKVEQLEEVRDLLSEKTNITEEDIETYSQKYNITIYIRDFEDRQANLSKMINNNEMINNRRKNRYDLNDVGEGNRVIKHMGMEILEYYKVLSNGKILILRLSTDSIKSTVGIVNQFFLYGGITILLGSLFFVYIFSKQITRPIIGLNEIIKGMVKMDFSYRTNIKSGDELEELGENINFLASELEKNIEKFKISNRKLQEEVDKRRKIDELRKEFIASVTHEIKTPITVINTHAEMLLYDLVEKEGEKKEYLRTIMSEGNNISGLLTELIEIIKLEEKIIDIKIEELNLSKLLEEELNKYKIDLEEKNVTLKMNLEENLVALGDESKIRQVLTNIISNAVSYVDLGGELRINMISSDLSREQIGDGEVKIEIINTGSFIPEEKIENIWKAFYTIDKSRNKKYGGTGLGLTIVSGILERHNSKFGVENLENGVKFWFSLKLKV